MWSMCTKLHGHVNVFTHIWYMWMQLHEHTCCSTIICLYTVSHAGVTSCYTRVAEPSEDMPLETFSPPTGLSAPEKVHIMQRDHNGRGDVGKTYAFNQTLYHYMLNNWYTQQNLWFKSELKKVNREEIPWLLFFMHSMWYNNKNYHYMEGENTRISECIFNISYNITDGLSPLVKNPFAPIYITIGHGGNIEGIANDYSLYRDMSFGHAMLEMKNMTHALYTWHRNQDDEPVIADSLWVKNKYFLLEEEKTF
ncbi:hypothetical protein EUTSA_v10011037mg [Eutrema salsugineum]|uniref:Purple acid phosphatase C-terminal domain-containing protein n=1 Tax=Eutrema salsugineum TaxID=72664 RepID=V4NI76_EUTSA|nr:hypothetical protein EUTSA_v10011037mg [Eutrema salsugineum]